MKPYLRHLAITAFLTAGIMAKADCSVNLAVVEVPQDEDVPQASINYLNSKLQQIALSDDGVIADPDLGQFFITGKFSHILEDVTPGPPAQTVLHTNLTLYIGDLSSQAIYATVSLDLRGVGTSSQRAFINALRSLNVNNKNIAAFISTGKGKVIDYYNQNYSQILAQAKKAAAQHNYDEALWRVSMIPECCIGYDQALQALNTYFQAYIDQNGLAMLNAASAAWASQPDAEGAKKALSFLLAIDPESTAFPQAQKLLMEIKSSVKSDRDFILRTKYEDSIDLERRRIQAAKEVGVAFGKGQQPKTTNLNWLH